jgi:hypothetical protein
MWRTHHAVLPTTLNHTAVPPVRTEDCRARTRPPTTPGHTQPHQFRARKFVVRTRATQPHQTTPNRPSRASLRVARVIGRRTARHYLALISLPIDTRKVDGVETRRRSIPLKGKRTVASAKRPTTKSISPACSKAIEDGKCKRLVNHKGDCRPTLKANVAKSPVSTKASPRAIMQRVNRRSRVKAVKGQYKFVLVNGTKFRVSFDGTNATLTKVVKQLRAVPSDRVVAASTKSVKRPSFRNSGRPTLARPSVG